MSHSSAWPVRHAASARLAPGSGFKQAPDVQLRQVLFSQGFGTRRECDALIQHGLVQVGERLVDDPHEDVDTTGLVFSVRGQAWPFHERALLMMNKPPGYECSRKPKHHPSVMSLLPSPLLLLPARIADFSPPTLFCSVPTTWPIATQVGYKPCVVSRWRLGVANGLPC